MSFLGLFELFHERHAWSVSAGGSNHLHAIPAHGAKLIHIGSSTQIGALRYQPADENHPEFPNDMIKSFPGCSAAPDEVGSSDRL